MAIRGRPRKPTRLRILEGNRSKTPILPEPQPEGEPVKPENLADEASELWDSHVTQLIELGIATRLDQAMLERMCNWFAIYVRLETLILFGEWDNKTVATAGNAFRMFELVASKFGMTPCDRSKLAGVGKARAKSKAERFMA